MTYHRSTVPVDGGDLTVGVWGDGGPLVVAAHGITSHHLGFGLVGPPLGADHRFVAVDLRGRGGSRDLPGPYGMDRHAADLAAVVRAYGGPAVVVAHSMGCWAAIALARAEPALVERLVLVDGGPPLPPPPGVDANPTPEQIDAAVNETVGQAYARLSMTFPDREAYRQLWRSHPALRDWNPAMDAYADYDLVRDGSTWRPACRLEAARRDARDLYAWPGHPGPVALPVPAVFLRAERGMLDQPEPFYRPGVAAHWLPGIDERAVPGTNHYTITLGPTGAAAVVAAVRGYGRLTPAA
jgi:lipase